jgi:HK97 family phage major capsid protein
MNAKEALVQKRAQVAGDMAALTAAVQVDSRPMNDEENGKFEALKAEYVALGQSIQNFEFTEQVEAEQARPQSRVVQPEPTVSMTPVPQAAVQTSTRPAITGNVVAHGYENHGFKKGLGEFLLAARNAVTAGRVDPRLMVNAVTTWAGESVGADGGYALPPQFVQGIMSLVAAEDSFIRGLMPYPTQSDIITVPKDEDAPWSTAAVTAAKTAEGVAITGSKPAVGQLKVPMYGVKSLVHVDEKSLRDMVFLAAYIERKMAEKIRWKVENYVMNGTGENEPLGIINAPGLNTLAEGDSTATALGAGDIMKMEAMSLTGPGGFWVAHPTAVGPVRVLISGTGGYPLYTPDFKASPGGGLLGYPLYKSFAAKPLDTTGDILFVKPDGYFLAFEQGGAQNATTIAFAFDQNLQSFRSTLYMGGAPTLAAKVLLPDATNYVSNLTALAGSRS